MSRTDKLIETAAKGETLRQQAQIKGLKQEVRLLEQSLHAANVRAEVVAGLKAGTRPAKPIKHRANIHRRVATPVFLFSDWHVEEVVKSEKVLGLNAYTPEIAAGRIERLGEACSWMIEHHRTSFEIRECVVALAGDFMSGYIHDELVEGNALSPVQTMLFLQEHLTNLLNRILAVPGMERIAIVTNFGNHGRTTHKIRVSTGAENSYEWLLYHQLKRAFAHEKRIDWTIASGEFVHIKVHDLDLGFTHGNAVNYGGGVGGITIPIKRAIPRWDSFQRADIWHMGHFHQLHDLPGLVVNGSLIGTGPYGMRVGGYEIPAQASYLIDAKRKVKCMSTTLWPVGSSFGQVTK
jgi:hypothetical protein